MTHGIGHSIPRFEDERFITGKGRYVANIRFEDAIEMVVIRSPYAHASIGRISTSDAEDLSGVVAAWTAEDLGPLNEEFPVQQLRPHPGLHRAVNHRALARQEVRYVGEPVAVVIGEDRYVAKDAALLVSIDYEPLPAVASLEAALASGAALVHEQVPGNVAGRYTQGMGDVERAFEGAAHVLHRRLRIDRGAAHPMEPRAIVADPGDGEELVIWTGTQIPHRLRDFVAGRLGLDPERVRVVAPDTGGSFGVKAYAYPEEVLVPYAALRLGRPVRWIEERSEHGVATFPERAQLFEASVAVDEDGRFLGLDVEFFHDLGAYAPYGFAVPQNTANHLLGPYRIPAARIAWQGFYTNLTPTATYRGAGRPQGTFVIERLLDLVARTLEIDPLEVRRRNLIPPEEQPFDTGMDTPIGRLVYDSGDYPTAQAMAADRLPYGKWRECQERLRAEGRRLGLGVANYLECSVTFPYEGVSLAVEMDGTVLLSTGASQQGQGYETVFAQVCADVFGMVPERVRVVAGDTAMIERGAGNYGSRVAIMVGTGVRLAGERIKERSRELAAEALGISMDDVEWIGAGTRMRATPGTELTLGELARLADLSGKPLEESVYIESPGLHVANGAHAAVVEVDPETGWVSVIRYVAVHDCGRMINPMLVEGQIVGGLVQGLGGALRERMVYDELGQPMTVNFMEYALPRAEDFPSVELHHLESASPLNPWGFKGAGEGGIIPVYAVIAAALEDAIGVPVDELPVTSEQVLGLCRKRQAEGGRNR